MAEHESADGQTPLRKRPIPDQLDHFGDKLAGLLDGAKLDRCTLLVIAAAVVNLGAIAAQLRKQSTELAVANERTKTAERKCDAAMAELAAKVGESDRLREQLTEEQASHNPLLRCLLIKAAPDQDLYIGWSNNVEAPTGVWTRAEALAYGFPPSRLDRADRNGTSSRVPGSGQWNDNGFVAEQRGWLRRDRLGDYALAYARDDMDAAYDLLEPFEGETEVRRD